jgi:hypothetical protein
MVKLQTPATLLSRKDLPQQEQDMKKTEWVTVTIWIETNHFAESVWRKNINVLKLI